MLTQKDILKMLRTEPVFLGKDPNRTFDMYEENGLLPEPQGHRNNEPLYPDHTPWVIKDILLAQQVGKLTMADIKKEFHQGIEGDSELFRMLGLADPPLNVHHRQKLHGRYGSKDADVLVAIYENRIIFFLVEGFRNRSAAATVGTDAPFRILHKKALSMDQYGEYVKEQAIRRITGEGMLLEEIYLLEILFG